MNGNGSWAARDSPPHSPPSAGFLFPLMYGTMGYMKINLTLAIALLCALTVFIPWALEALEYTLPAGVRGFTTLIGLLGLCVFAASIYRARR